MKTRWYCELEYKGYVDPRCGEHAQLVIVLHPPDVSPITEDGERLLAHACVTKFTFPDSTLNPKPTFHPPRVHEGNERNSALG
jgi:hypothetical protein